MERDKSKSIVDREVREQGGCFILIVFYFNCFLFLFFVIYFYFIFKLFFFK